MSIRVQVYYKDMGVYHKSHIEFMSESDYNTLLHTPTATRQAVKIEDDDWYGNNLPSTIERFPNIVQ
jgi:hypothetical protein